MTFSWISDFVPTSLFAMKFRTLAFGPLGTLPSTPRRIGICVPPHDIQHHCHKLIGSSMSDLGQKQKCPGSRGTSVLPSGADIVSLPRHVRLVPFPDLRNAAKGAHSITSSASNCIEFGTSMPSAFAVFMLMTSSNLLGRMTGKIGRLLAFENAADEASGLAIGVMG